MGRHAVTALSEGGEECARPKTCWPSQIATAFTLLALVGLAGVELVRLTSSGDHPDLPDRHEAARRGLHSVTQTVSTSKWCPDPTCSLRVPSDPTTVSVRLLLPRPAKLAFPLPKLVGRSTGASTSGAAASSPSASSASSNKYSSAALADEVTSLPGLSETPAFRHFSGYLPISSTKNIFYW